MKTYQIVKMEVKRHKKRNKSDICINNFTKEGSWNGDSTNAYEERDLLKCEICDKKFCKGQLISKCLLGVIVWFKKPTKFFPGFLP